MLSPAIISSIEKSVLCWLATSSQEGIPNVSPKEIFTHFEGDSIIIANIASPQTVKNIRQNPQVCISFVDILVQKGFQLKGTASIIRKADKEFTALSAPLLAMTGGKFPFTSLTHIKISQAKPILAPRYILFPETTEEEQIRSSIEQYGLS
ncbi:MAG: pyridoxamine 5'-phosphate oxidase family protein [Bacteroidia bacterium]